MEPMPSNRLSRVILKGLLATLIASAAMPCLALAQANSRAVTRPVEPNFQPMKKGRVEIQPVPGSARGTKEPDGQPSGIVPSGGVELYQRMGAALPPAPPEKAYTGAVDDAYGAYQRGMYVTALDKALTRAGAGDAAAQTLVAEMMTKGLGIKRDAKTAAYWYQKAAEGGDPAAMFQYALLLMTGRDVPRDKSKADDLMRRAAEAGNASAQFNWAQILVSENPGDKGLHRALPFYEKSARQGVADSQYAVAQVYVTLKDLPAEKKARAREWLERAATAGFDTAQLDMGLWLVNGVAGDRDYEKGFEWLRIAAHRGNVVAQNKLAHLYVNALGTRPDPVEAAKWYVLSRRAGLQDPELEDFYLGINEDQQRQAIDAANKFRRG
ncbi:tetratricopeptide repeat protein [Neorhizobium galegae]|uniref:tetratricopeptide repeat protein n=1 Tax=Neorhizobium galegae TaxID=399 RepID=UPI000621F047|nr:sel1 repeat family protein [Neorhizobium galegae]CDZ57391.1 Sel1 domain protein repeat-containing protein [Neorhizobium galegae bv. orientalis]